MRLLFDENLSHRLVGQLADAYPESAHVREVGLLGAEDRQIWAYAAAHGLLLVSKDTDFYQRSLVFGAPPKVICSASATRLPARSRSCFASGTCWFAVS